MSEAIFDDYFQRIAQICSNHLHKRFQGSYFRADCSRVEGFKRGDFPIWTCPSFLVLLVVFGGIFPILAGISRFLGGSSRLVLILCLGL